MRRNSIIPYFGVSYLRKQIFLRSLINDWGEVFNIFFLNFQNEGNC